MSTRSRSRSPHRESVNVQQESIVQQQVQSDNSVPQQQQQVQVQPTTQVLTSTDNNEQSATTITGSTPNGQQVTGVDPNQNFNEQYMQQMAAMGGAGAAQGGYDANAQMAAQQAQALYMNQMQQWPGYDMNMMNQMMMMSQCMPVNGMTNPAAAGMAGMGNPMGGGANQYGQQGQSMGKGGPQQGAEFKQRRFKTRLCQFHVKMGNCKQGDQCNFAHSEDELPAAWKTTLCSNYETKGQCIRGENCGFAHGKGDLREFRPERVRAKGGNVQGGYGGGKGGGQQW